MLGLLFSTVGFGLAACLAFGLADCSGTGDSSAIGAGERCAVLTKSAVVRQRTKVRFTALLLSNRSHIMQPCPNRNSANGGAGVEFERWSLEQAVEMTAEYLRRKEDAKFEDAFAKAGI